ncbi:MAG TPA: YjjG family noncanonical pyrimidine nucleotidase [Candidatus Fournierella pullicola]|uniref:YjjG family noncanonical pyrimidine nucleotidase n=1 Tax=Candidatus Allofournierella pullicola TaxID=2838596 RepID=A0A9D1V3A6_9FIRM|nr:YjjG family noncanonical pyrimidine nucleotidase [Candidatus Fournierella pullicola]
MAYYHCLLLDVDGTLMDFGAAEHKAFLETMSEFGLPATQEVEETYHTINKGLWAALEKGQIKRERLVVRRFEELLAALGSTGDAAVMNTFYLNRLSEHADLIPGALEAVKELAEVATLAVVTNGVEHVQEKRLKESGLGEYMDDVFISERLGVEKPNRRFFEIALRTLGIENKSKVLVVGDSLTADVKGGQNAGLDTCWTNWNGAEAPAENGPTRTVRTWEELLEIVMEPDELENVGQTRRKHQFEQGG